MYIYLPSSWITLADITPNILSYTRPRIIFDRCLFSAINNITIITKILNKIPSISAQAELNASAYARGSHVGIQRCLLPGDWSSQCGLERNSQAAIILVLPYCIVWNILSTSLLCVFPHQTFLESVPALSIEPRLANVQRSHSIPGECGAASTTIRLFA